MDKYEGNINDFKHISNEITDCQKQDNPDVIWFKKLKRIMEQSKHLFKNSYYIAINGVNPLGNYIKGHLK